MAERFLPAVPGEVLPCETPSELVGRIAARAGVRGLLRVITGTTISAYSVDDARLTDEDISRITIASRAAVVAPLARNELRSFVQSTESGDYYRVPPAYWVRLVSIDPPPEPAGVWGIRPDGTSIGVQKHHDPDSHLRLNYYQHCASVEGEQSRFVGQPILIAMRDGDALVGGVPVSRPIITTTVVYAPAAAEAPSVSGNEDKPAHATDKNGCPGRPTVIVHCETIMRERHAEGLTLGKITWEARAVIEAFKVDSRFNHMPPCGVGTIKNNLTKLYNELTGKAQWPTREATE